MTQDEREAIAAGVSKWAEACWKDDWINQRRWWTRLVHWYHWKFHRVFLPWYEAAEISSSISGYIRRELEEAQLRSELSKDL